MHSSGNQTLPSWRTRCYPVVTGLIYHMSILTLRHSSMLYYFNSVPIHIAHLMMSYVPYQLQTDCQKLMYKEQHTRTIPMSTQRWTGVFGYFYPFSEGMARQLYTVTRKSNGSLFVKPQAELPGWLYGMGCTICIFCSGNTCICQYPSTRAQTPVGYNKAKGQMGYL
jgi:hypothetical protein